MARLYNQFEFIGNISIPKDKDKFHEVNLKQDENGWESHKLNFGIQESKTNSVYVELYGGYSTKKSNKVFSFGKGTENVKGEKLEIPWEDRFSSTTLDMVADFKKIVVDFTEDAGEKEAINKLRYEIKAIEYKDKKSVEETEKLKELKTQLKEKATNRYEFISEYDAIICFANSLEDYKNKKFRITGSIEYQEWKGKFYKKFKPELFEIVPEETPNQLRATYDIFFLKDAVDEGALKTDKKIFIDGYVASYDNRAKKDQFYPQQFVINAAKVDFENETHVKRLDFLKNKFSAKGKNAYHLQWLVNIVRGAERVEFTMDDLTVAQKEAIEFGMNSLQDFAPKGGMLGTSIEEFRLVKPLLQKLDKVNDFTNGAVETDYTEDDLGYATTEDEKFEDIVKEVPKKEEATPTLEDDLDDIFA